MPVTLPAKVARPPDAVSWLAVSAVTVSAAVAPSPTPATSRAAPAEAGRGTGEPRPAALRFPYPGKARAVLAGESGRTFTPKECGSDNDKIMKQAPRRSGQAGAEGRPVTDRLHVFFIRADSLGSNRKSPPR